MEPLLVSFVLTAVSQFSDPSQILVFALALASTLPKRHRDRAALAVTLGVLLAITLGAALGSVVLARLLVNFPDAPHHLFSSQVPALVVSFVVAAAGAHLFFRGAGSQSKEGEIPKDVALQEELLPPQHNQHNDHRRTPLAFSTLGRVFLQTLFWFVLARVAGASALVESKGTPPMLNFGGSGGSPLNTALALSRQYPQVQGVPLGIGLGTLAGCLPVLWLATGPFQRWTLLRRRRLSGALLLILALMTVPWGRFFL